MKEDLKHERLRQKTDLFQLRQENFITTYLRYLTEYMNFDRFQYNCQSIREYLQTKNEVSLKSIMLGS